MKKPKPKAKKDGASPALSVAPCSASVVWRKPEDAPHDELILADFGWPWPVPAMWDAQSESWASMSAQRDSNSEGVALNAWFETEYEDQKNLRRWCAMPALPNTRRSDTEGRSP